MAANSLGESRYYLEPARRRLLTGRLLVDWPLTAGRRSCFLLALDRTGFLLVSPGAESGGRIDTPGIDVGVIQSDMMPSVYVSPYYIAAGRFNKGRSVDRGI